VNKFVEECRSEWKRLGVPDSVANEMAADLAADLEEAEAEGASAEDVLGSGAFDPRSFAAAWAAERGVIPRPRQSGHELPRRSRMVAAIGVFALIAVIGGMLVIVAAPSGPTRLALTALDGPQLPRPPGRAVLRLAPPPPRDLIGPGDLIVTVPPTRIVAVDINDSGVDTRTVGWVLLTVGIAGVVPLTMFWLWVGPGRWSGRRPQIDDRPNGRVY
jgi:hypothetical protein